MKKNLLYLPVLVLLFSTCRQHEKAKPDDYPQGKIDSVKGLVVADTITYDVKIIPLNQNDTWAVECLRGLDHKLLIDNIFNWVYAGKVTAFNHETGEKLTPNQVENMESTGEFSREQISMIQFTEVWFLSPQQATLSKEVIRMVLGRDRLGSSGELIGHTALFRVEMK